MYVLTAALLRELDAHGFVYQKQGRLKHGEDHITLSFGGKHVQNLVTHILFFQKSQSMQIQILDIISVPPEKLQALFGVVNELNQEYRFAKFYIDSIDMSVEMNMDVLLPPDVDTGVLCYDAVIRAMQICDDAYKKLMYSVYADQYLGKQ